MRWRPQAFHDYLAANTAAFEQVLQGRRPGFIDLVRIHWMRGGWVDHLLVLWLGPLTLGLTAWLWLRYQGSCCFAGFIDREAGRGGCLIHPARLGEPDLRRHAFPAVILLGCNRALRCPLLERADAHLTLGLQQASRAGAASLGKVSADSE